MSSVYEPREDSDLLAEHVARLARGAVLDMGTGSGVQALAAVRNPAVTSVTAVDINPEAVRAANALFAQHGVNGSAVALESDMFSAIPDSVFDTIVCNAPYLPQPDDDSDPALYGGPEGWEWTVRFLRELSRHLAPDGQAFLLFSTMTGRDRIDLELHRLGLRHELLASMPLFFERLLVYRIWTGDAR